MKNPYEVLGVAQNADADTIRKAYKQLARKFHPDRNASKDAEARFKEINRAYEILGDEKKKKLWNEFGEVSTKPGFDEEQARAYTQGGSRGFRSGFGGGFADDGTSTMEDMLGSLFGSRPRGPKKGRDLQASLSVDPLLSFVGGETSVSIFRNGQNEPLQVRIPAGAKDGGQLRLKGQGESGPRGGLPGDLLLRLHIPEHPYFRRHGDDLELEVPVTLLEIVERATISVPTPTGAVKTSLPENANNGTRMRIRGKGVQRAQHPGDLYLILRPTLPERITPEMLEAAKIFEEGYLRPVREDLRR